ncbi:MAG TPA: plasmid partitioning protein RepB C-terminal domain-containing protein [Phycisphaerae bacterium]|nr:plasmid partitioning protein RepB C-terminal domain-containing protein [Phycisphaerae bacterium]HRW53120.1 plasmid partitioning protein RepB C-terminal domain-containing protein [Phycisphaerae bacterium]
MISRNGMTIQMIPIDQINVLNPRTRGQAKFKSIVNNISKLGLKRPITVAKRKSRNGDAQYDLACGQGRLEAFRALGQTEVPAIVIEASKNDLLLMSLVENLARRRYTSLELADEIRVLRERGYKYSEIAAKTDLDTGYVRDIDRLLKKGEKRLIQAVERGQIPISIAVTIASSDDAKIQRALADAYESKNLRGKALLKARRLIERRRTYGKGTSNGGRPADPKDMTSEKLLRTYKRETQRQRQIIAKSKVCEARLLFVVTGLKSLFDDEGFVNLLRAERLDTLPKFLAERIYAEDDA